MPKRCLGEWMYRSMYFLILALLGNEWSASSPDSFTPGERALGTPWIEGFRARLDDMQMRNYIIFRLIEVRIF
jgi:hypothetical protein